MLPQSFFLGDTAEIARSMVGKYLIRGLEPRYNADIIAENRFGRKTESDCRKDFLDTLIPVRDRSLNGLPHGSSALFLCEGLSDADLPHREEAPAPVRAGRRIGIDYAGEATEFPWRFYL